MPPRLTRHAALALLTTFLTAIVHGTGLRVTTMNVELGLGAPGTAAHDATVAILARLDADVVALQELQDDDLLGNPSSLDRLAAALGYQEVHLAGLSGVFDFKQRGCFLSRFPISSATNIVPPSGAKDMTRQFPAIVVDVPGSDQDPIILNLHLKCCLEPDDPFRRAVELQRVTGYLQSHAFTSADNLIVLGDFNLIGSDLEYPSLPDGLPATFALGADVRFPLQYFASPAAYFEAWSMTPLDARQLNGSPVTSGSSTLDFILATSALTDRPHQSEIYNSALDISNRQGLAKAGSPLPSETSREASDHFALFADFDLGVFPPLAIHLSNNSLSESDPPGTALLTISLPSAPVPGESVLVTLSTSDASEAIPAQSSLHFAPGVTSLQVEIIPRPDALLDGSQLVSFTARAPGFASASIDLTVTDANSPFFSFTVPGQTIREDFDTFDGTADPARWPTSGGIWQGLDDGGSATPGNYSYGADPSLGFLLEGEAIAAAADYHNHTGKPIAALQIQYEAEQWRSSLGGAADHLLADLLIDNTPVPLPALTFTADSSLPTGPVLGGATTSLSTVVTGLSIAPGGTFQLRFTATPGVGGGSSPADLFVNEFHYDNRDSDQGEFVEIAVGPGYHGFLSEAALVLYNGNGGSAYATHSLDTFTLGHTTSSGHRLLSKAIAGIQNGAPDGFAVVRGNTVLQFLSYEGAFTATNGPAAGMTSIDLGVRQDSPIPPPGSQSLGLRGTGGVASDFAWTRFTGPYTRGAPNPGQSFTAPPGSQGLALDNIAVSLLLDTDLDGDPDLTDLDDDNDGLPDSAEAALGTDPLLADSDQDGTSDGDEDPDRDRQSNFAEVVLTLTDPLDPRSRFQASLLPTPDQPRALLLAFPTLTGRSYTVERSHDLLTWTVLSTHPGDGSPQTIPVPGDPRQASTLFRVRVSLP